MNEFEDVTEELINSVDFSTTIDEASWIGEDVIDYNDVIEDFTKRIANGDLSHQIF